MAIELKQRLHWLALHGFVRGLSAIGARRGDLQARLIADPAVKADPVPFYEEVRARGPAGAVQNRLPHRRPRDRPRIAAIR